MPISLTSIRPKRFQFVDPTRAVSNVRRSQQRYLQAVAKKLAEYPPQRPGTRYRRTYKLKRGWETPHIVVSSDGSTATLTNPVYYAVFAEGPRYAPPYMRQTKRMRALGWPSVTDVARETKRAYVQLMNRAIRGAPGEVF